jgi:hypothetical protein
MEGARKGGQGREERENRWELELKSARRHEKAAGWANNAKETRIWHKSRSYANLERVQVCHKARVVLSEEINRKYI